MKPYSLDDFWELLKIEYAEAARSVPWIDRAFYRLALRWLEWRLRRLKK